MPRDNRAPDSWSSQNIPESPETPLKPADTGSMQPIPEAIAWAERADAWAQRSEGEPGSEVVPSRWSEVAAPGRTAFPEDGVGWRTETAEWRATEQTARWRQTTEWRSASGTHGWRSTTEAWHTGAGAETFQPAANEPLAISSTAWPTAADESTTHDAVWQQADDPASGSWQRRSEGAWQPEADDRPPWQQFAAAPQAPWDQPAPQSWQPPAPRAADGPPAWQQLVDPAENGRGYIDAESTRSVPFDDGRHPVREEDRAQWQQETGSAGRRRAEETGIGGTGWSTPSDADGWAGHKDTGGMPRYGDPAADGSPTWSASAPPSASSTWSGGAAPAAPPAWSTGAAPAAAGGQRRWTDGEDRPERPSWAQSSSPAVNGWAQSAPAADPADADVPSWRRGRSGADSAGEGWPGGNGAAPVSGLGQQDGSAANGRTPAWRQGDADSTPPWRPSDDASSNGSTPSWRQNGEAGPNGSAPDWRQNGAAGPNGSTPSRREDGDGGLDGGTPAWRQSPGPAAIGWRAEDEPGDPGNGWSGNGDRRGAARERPSWAQSSSPVAWRQSPGPAAIGWRGSEPEGPDGGVNGNAVNGSTPTSSIPRGRGTYGSTPTSSVPQSGATYGSTPTSGVPRSGGTYGSTPTSSVPQSGATYGSTPRSGATYGSTPTSSVPHTGAAYGSAAYGSAPSSSSSATYGSAATSSGAKYGSPAAPSSGAAYGRRSRPADRRNGTEPDRRDGSDTDWRDRSDTDWRDRSDTDWQDPNETGRRDRGEIDRRHRGETDRRDRSEADWKRDSSDRPDWRHDSLDEPGWQEGPRRRRDGRGWQPDDDGWREPGAETTRRRREAAPADPWAQNAADTGVIPMTWQPPEPDTGSWRSGAGAVGRARPTNPNRRRPGETSGRMRELESRPSETRMREIEAAPADRPYRSENGTRPGDTGTRMGAGGVRGTRPGDDNRFDTGTRLGGRRRADDARDGPLDPDVYRREPGVRSGAASWPVDEPPEADWPRGPGQGDPDRRRGLNGSDPDWRRELSDNDPDWRQDLSDSDPDWRRDLGDSDPDRPRGLNGGDPDWRRELSGEPDWRRDLVEPSVGDAVTEVRQRIDPATWQRDEGAQRGSASYRENGTGDWRRALAAESGSLADGESRRFGTQDFVPFKPVNASAAAPVSAPKAEPAPVASDVRERWEDAADNVWPPRQPTGYQNTGGSYERRPVTGSVAANLPNNLLEPDDDDLEEDTGGPLAAVGYTVIWYGVPVVLFVLYMLVLNGSQQAHALSTLAGAAPQFGLSLLLSMVVAVGLRKASGSWKAASVGLAAAVMGGGLATVLSSAITGNSLS